MKIDLHTHSVMSGHAYSTITEMAKSAASRGVEVMAITEHGPALEDSPHLSYFMNSGRMMKEEAGVRILKGVEANVINEKGEIDLPDFVLKKLDVVIAAFHETGGYVDQGPVKNAEVAAKVMANPYVKIFAHPYAKYFDFDLERVVQASIENDVLIEFNASYLEGDRFADEKILGNMKETMRLLKKAGRKIVLTSDAHNHQEVGEFTKALSMLDEFGLTEDDIINKNIDEVLEFLGVDL